MKESGIGVRNASSIQNGENKRDFVWRTFEAVLLSGLLILLYWNVLRALFRDWWIDPNYSHGFIVPIFAGYLIWKQKDKLQSIPIRGSWVGLPVLLLGIAALVFGEIGAQDFIAGSSLIVVISGLILLNLGMEIFKAVSFPVFFLFFMIPLPAVIFYAIAFPLQTIAAKSATLVLDLLGVPVLLEGHVIHLSHTTLGVTEACSGIRSLISLLALAAAWSYLSFKGILARAVLMVSAVPITIAANSTRVILTAFIAQWFGMQYAEGFYHTFAGWIIFIVAFAGLAGVHALIRLTQQSRF